MFHMAFMPSIETRKWRDGGKRVGGVGVVMRMSSYRGNSHKAYIPLADIFRSQLNEWLYVQSSFGLHLRYWPIYVNNLGVFE